MARQVFINIAVEDLQKSIAFFTALGFNFNPQFTDEHATCMLITDDTFAMIMDRGRFKDFTGKEIIDPHSQIEAIFSLSADSRDDVDTFVDSALAAGATKANDPQDMGFMYNRSFNDPDGHTWEVFSMDMAAMAEMNQQTQ